MDSWKMDQKQVFLELNEASRLWGHKSTATPENIRRILHGLGFVLIRCPDEIAYMVEGFIIEGVRRLEFAETGR